MKSHDEPRLSLAKNERIAKRSDFKRTYDSGQKVFGKFVVLFWMPNLLGVTRIGITATRKIGKAHDRNRLKRWVRETYRTRRASIGADRVAVDIVVNLKTSATRASFDDFATDLGRAIRRAVTDATPKP
jgi:ribonuclease P protein component